MEIKTKINKWNPIKFKSFCTIKEIISESESHSVMFNSLQPHGLYSPWNPPGQNTGVGRHSLLQGIFPTQGLNLPLASEGRFFTIGASRDPCIRAKQTTLHTCSHLVLRMRMEALKSYSHCWYVYLMTEPSILRGIPRCSMA